MPKRRYWSLAALLMTTCLVAGPAAAGPVDVDEARSTFDKVIETYAGLESFHSTDTLDMAINMMGMSVKTPTTIETRFARPNKLRMATSTQAMGMAIGVEICNDGESVYVVQSMPMQEPMAFRMPAPQNPADALAVGGGQAMGGSSPITEAALAFGKVPADCVVDERLTVDAAAAAAGDTAIAPEGVMVVPVEPVPGMRADLFIRPEDHRLVGYYAEMGPEFFKATIGQAMGGGEEAKGMAAMMASMAENMSAVFVSTLEHLDADVTDADFEFTPLEGVELHEVADQAEMLRVIMEKAGAMQPPGGEN